MESYEEIRAETLKALEQGKHDDAYQQFRWVLEYGSDYLDGSERQFVEAIEIFSTIATHFAPDEFVEKIRAVAERPGDIQASYELGYMLYEEGLFGIAATVLSRADQLAPGQPAIISELVMCLENMNRCGDAVALLQTYADMADEDFLLAYHLAFNGVMSGDMELGRQQFVKLPELADESEDARSMVERIGRFVKRFDQVRNACQLDPQDLRGWHYVITGGLLTHLSPYGYPEPMNGRYAFVQDNASVVHDGINELVRIVGRKGLEFKQVLAIEDRSSEILAAAIAKTLGLPSQSWDGKSDAEDSLIVAYDLSAADLEPYESLRLRRPGQLLYSHAHCWVRSCPIAPDVVTFLHQYNTSPWDSQMRADSESEEPTYSDPDDRPIEVIADELLASEPFDPGELEGEESSPAELSDELIDALGRFPLSGGMREIAWETSPVQSSRFA